MSRSSRKRTPAGPPPPAPEIIDGGEWQITESATLRQGGILRNRDGPGGRMTVPFGAAEQARLIRAHELMHVNISEKGWPRPYNEMLMNWLEDGRVHRHLATTGFDLQPLSGVLGDDELTPDALKKHHPAILAGFVIGSHETGEAQRVKQAIAAIGRQDIIDVADQLSFNLYPAGRRPSIDDLAEMADQVVRAFGDPDEPPPPSDPPPPLLPPPPQPGAGAKQQKQQQPPPQPQPAPPAAIRIQNKKQYLPQGMTEWGDMTITEAPLVRRLPGKMRARRKLRPDDRGRRLRYLDRVVTDGRVFASRIRVKGGGSVLIDTSGSMSITNEEVEQIVQALPGGIVATYEGDSVRDTGELRVVAKKGRYCAIEHIRAGGGHNIIDGPALEWLGKQPAPRYWVSDGKATGRGGKQDPVLLAEVARICKRNVIRRVPKIAALFGTEE